MSVGQMRRYGWIVLIFAGCYGMLPPPPPPKMRTAPAVAQTPVQPAKPKVEVPRGPDSAPEHFKVKFDTSKGDFVVEVHREWSPRGADHFYQLVKAGFYNDMKFFRVVPDFMAQFGISGDPKMNEKYMKENIQDDEPVGISNTRGKITFAKASQPNSRSTQVFISYGDNSRLDADGFTPFGEVVEGMDVVDELNGEYGEQTTELQGTIAQAGNAFLDDRFPNLDSINSATIISPPGEEEPSKPAEASEEQAEKAETDAETKDQ